MLQKLLSHITKSLILTFFALGSVCPVLLAQEDIGGIINSYARVTSTGPGYVTVLPAQASQFLADDYVLLIQMQGVGITTVSGSYGITVQQTFGTPGGYEFLIVESVNPVSGRIDFTRNVFINTYDVESNVQLIRVPFYNSPVVTSTLTAQPWNGAEGTGGVLALMAGRKLTLGADLDVTGTGFSGAAGVDGIGECVASNIDANSLDSYPLSYNNAGLKGEGVAIHDDLKALLYPQHAKGQGRNFTGGGGGNGWFSGGGGGSNRGKGGDGGPEKFVLGLCGNDRYEGGYGGMNIVGSFIEEGIFLGGGGGASTRASGSTASPGGNGGGIVIIVADSIYGNNHVIRTNGLNAANASGDAGAGGGGAAGSVAISVQGFRGQLNISANGGNGGVNTAGFGNGGGGAGGLIWLSSASMPSSVPVATVAYGTIAPTNPQEGTGEIKFNYVPALNGFLFNTIYSAATGNRIDSVCSDTQYGQLLGSRPAGGTPPYSFLWQSSTTSATSGFSTAAGTYDQQHYTPPALLAQTTWFRRIVTDSEGDVTDISLPVRLIVHPAITNNVVGNPATLCYGQNAPLLNSIGPVEDGNGTYEYQWETSADNLTFILVEGNNEGYLHDEPLVQTAWFRRIVTSGACIDASASVRITVLDSIRNNSIITPAQEICEGMEFSSVEGTSASVLTGGDNLYRYRWESSIDGTTWETASGNTTMAVYDPDESEDFFPGQAYFRRVVLSGANDVCVNLSKPVLLTTYPVIKNNLISADQTVCSGSVPAGISGSVPLDGNGAFTYTWQDSTANQSWTDIPGYVNVSAVSFSPPALTDTTGYRRIVRSSACTDISLAVRIDVHSPVSGNVVSLLTEGLTDTTICSGQTPFRFTGTTASGGTNDPDDMSYQWLSSTDNTVWINIDGATDGSVYQPSSLTATSWFRRRASSGQCFSDSEPIRINVLPSIANNIISGDQTVCRSDIPGPLGQAPGQSLSGGSGTYTYLWEESTGEDIWIPAAGTNNRSDGTYQPPALTIPTRYRRHVSSGAANCCTGISNEIEILIDALPEGYSAFAGRDTSIYTFDHIIQLAADPPLEGGSGSWSLVDGSGSFGNINDPETVVSGVSKGTNTFRWRVTRGACFSEDDIEVNVYDLFIPEGFSPNDDPQGYNNTFVVRGLDLENQTAELRIINGAGNEVYYTSNLDGNEWIDWDGRNGSGKDLPEGTYYYLLKITSLGNGQVFKKSGFIVLKRY